MNNNNEKLDIPFSPRSCNRFCKLPEFAFRNDAPSCFVSARHPVRGQADCCRELRVFRLGDEGNAFLFEELERIFEGFFVYGFKIRQLSLVVQRLSKLCNVKVFR